MGATCAPRGVTIFGTDIGGGALGCNPSRLLTHIIGGSTTAWKISLCAPPLADASLDRRRQHAYKSPRRGEALRTRGAPNTPGARVSGRWASVRGTPRGARRAG